MATHSFPVPTYFISIFWWFSTQKNIKWCHNNGNTKVQSNRTVSFSVFQFFESQNRANTFICLLDHTYEPPLATTSFPGPSREKPWERGNKIERQRCPEKPLILGRPGTQYVFSGISKHSWIFRRLQFLQFFVVSEKFLVLIYSKLHSISFVYLYKLHAHDPSHHA